MKVRVLLTNEFNEDDLSLDIAGSTILVIDSLRATSTIATILSREAEKVIVSPSRELSFKLKEMHPGYILCGEEKAVKIEGFDYNNSPVSMLGADLKHRTVVLKTSNGTKSFIKARNSRVAFALSVINLNYATETALNYATRNNTGLLYICSGKLGEVAYDDAFTAGLSINYLATRVKNLELDDAGHLVCNSASSENDIYKAFMKSCSVRYHPDVDLEEDIRFCAEPNRYNNCGKLEILDANHEEGPLYCIREAQ